MCSLFSFLPVVSQWIFCPVSLIQQKQKCEMQDSTPPSDAITTEALSMLRQACSGPSIDLRVYYVREGKWERLPTAVVVFSVSKMLRD